METIKNNGSHCAYGHVICHHDFMAFITTLINMLKFSSPHLPPCSSEVVSRVTVHLLPWCLTQPSLASSACPERWYWQCHCSAQPRSFPVHHPAAPDHLVMSGHNYHTLEYKRAKDHISLILNYLPQSQTSVLVVYLPWQRSSVFVSPGSSEFLQTAETFK